MRIGRELAVYKVFENNVRENFLKINHPELILSNC